MQTKRDAEQYAECAERTQYPSYGKPTGQTKLGSLAESLANIAIGFTINFICNDVFLPLVSPYHLSHRQNFTFGCIMTVVSLVRSYVLRRWFNGLKFGNSKK